MKREPTSVYIEQVPETGGRWWRVSCAFATIERARDPEHEITRELLALGIVGRMQTYVGGKASMNLSIATAAKQSVSDGASSRLRVVAWRSFDGEADNRTHESGTVRPPAARRQRWALCLPQVKRRYASRPYRSKALCQ